MEDKVNTIIELYKSGLSARNIQAKTGISSSQVMRLLKKNGVEIRSLRTGSEREVKIVEKYLSGQSSEQIGKDFNLNGTTICRILKRSNVEIRKAEENKRKYSIRSRYFSKIDSEEKSYLLGFLFADGNVSSTQGHTCIAVHEKDREIVENFGNAIYINKDYCVSRFREKYISVSVYSKEMKEDLVKHGCTPRKSFNLRLPNIDKTLMPHFLRGVFDGDGCFYHSEKHKSTISLIGSKAFLEDIRDFLFNELGVVGSFSKSKGSDRIYTVYYSKKIYLNKIINYIYNKPNIYLKRKLDKAAIIKSGIIDSKPNYYSTNNIVKYKGERLTANYIKSLSEKDKRDTASFAFDYFRANGFPFPKYSSDILISEFKRLCDYDISNGCSKSLVGQKITHHFCEHFFQVRGGNLPSLFDAFHDDEKLISTINNRMGISYKETFSITGNMIRQGLRNSYNAFGVSFFKPIIARYIYENYAPKNANVLDISAGFGQRMLGAVSSKNVDSYIGLDPWVDTIISINKMIDFFEISDKAKVINTGSEHFNTGNFNFCFSSPPFFNKEVYCDSKAQAYDGRSFDDFIKHWWVPTANNVYSMLEPDSLFILNMDPKMASEMIKEVSNIFVHEDTYSLSYSRAHKVKSAIESFFILRKR